MICLKSIKEQTWIKADFAKKGDVCPVFKKSFQPKADVKSAKLYVTAKGVYTAFLNDKRIGDTILTPGWTVYSLRHQYEEYDVTDLLAANTQNNLYIVTAPGWYHGEILKHHSAKARQSDWDAEIIALLNIEYADGSAEQIGSDKSWSVGTGPVISSDFYGGEVYDARKEYGEFVPVTVCPENKTDMLIPDESDGVREQIRLSPIDIITTPKGETVIDFGQNITGYPEITVKASAGEKISLSFAEILDKDGNFYNENYRSAVCRYEYTCRDGLQTYKPLLTFYGFRYLRVDEFPKSAELTPDCFTAVAVFSSIRRTGHLASSNAKLNQLFSNIFWGQRCNFVDVPTDCPQRDERLGWTGDAQVFVKAASYNFDIERFFRKWTKDMAADIKRFGRVGFVVPNVFDDSNTSPAWGDAAVIVPWQIYLTYGDKSFLEQNIDTMISHVELITSMTEEPYTWKGGTHMHCFGDWLGMDAPAGSYKGSTRDALICAAYYAYDVGILAKALEALGRDASDYRKLYEKIREKFRKDFPEYLTQTEYVLALHFRLAEDMKKSASELAEMIHKNGDRLTTGFVGTPYLLHALSDNGYADLAYTLLLQEAYPSWLFSVNMGATTMWEHWDGINDKGEVWSKDMNSFNHYAYGSVADWVYEKAAGIQLDEKNPGFAAVTVAPIPDKRLGMLEASIDTRHGTVSSMWYYKDGKCRYEITVPVNARIIIDGKAREAEKGTYFF